MPFSSLTSEIVKIARLIYAMETTAAYMQVSALIAPYIVTQPLVVVTSYSQSADSPWQLMHIQ